MHGLMREGRREPVLYSTQWCCLTPMVLFKGGWVIDLDIRSYFDCIDHDHLRAIFTQRVRDGVMVRTLGKWLNAGVLEDGAVTHPDQGTPQWCCDPNGVAHAGIGRNIYI